MKGANYIDGQWVDGSVPFETVNPSDLDETVGLYTKVGEAEVREAMAAARRAQPGWAAFNMQARVDLLYRVAELLKAQIGRAHV